jgi:hypothetical protein
MMVLASGIGLFILFEHLKGEKKAQDYKTSVNKNFVYSILLNLCALWGGAICFGKPYSPAIVYLAGIVFILILVVRGYPELVEWLERLFVILSIFSLAGEYFYCAVQHWIRTNKKKEIVFLLIIFSFSSIVVYFIHNCLS